MMLQVKIYITNGCSPTPEEDQLLAIFSRFLHTYNSFLSFITKGIHCGLKFALYFEPDRI
jgi:hypothetical protein